MLLEQLRQGRAVAGYSNKARPCQSIRDGAKQLREYIAGRRLAGVVVLFDTMAGLLGYLDAGSIAASLYGPEIFHFSVSDADLRAARPEAKFLGASLGGGRVVTPLDNTSLNAVGVLRFDRPVDRISLTLFHNCHAAISIAPDEFRISDVTHLAYRAHHTEMLPTWVRV
jgi:hypothetical protein